MKTHICKRCGLEFKHKPYQSVVDPCGVYTFCSQNCSNKFFQKRFENSQK
jgi:hypothetical protein